VNTKCKQAYEYIMRWIHGLTFKWTHWTHREHYVKCYSELQWSPTEQLPPAAMHKLQHCFQLSKHFHSSPLGFMEWLLQPSESLSWFQIVISWNDSSWQETGKNSREQGMVNKLGVPGPKLITFCQNLNDGEYHMYGNMLSQCKIHLSGYNSGLTQ
jgi:hypothetical protein